MRCPAVFDDIIDATENPVIPVAVDLGTIAGEVMAVVPFGPIGVDKPLPVSPDAPEHAGPWFGYCQITAAFFNLVAVLIENRRTDSGERSGRGTGLGGREAGERGDQNVAGLGLPPGVDYRAFAAADHVAIPHPGFGINRFAH